MQDSILTSPECSFKFSNKKSTDYNDPNDNDNFMSDDSLDTCSNIMLSNNLAFNDFCLTPLKSTENLLSPFSTTKNIKDYNLTDDNLSLSLLNNTSPFKPIESSTAAKTYSPEDRKPTRISVNLCNKFEPSPNNDLNNVNTTFIKDTIDPKLFKSSEKVEECSNLEQNHEWTALIKSKDKKYIFLNI